MRRAGIVVTIVGACTGIGAAAHGAAPEIHTEDVDRFYELYDATGGHPTAEQLQDYLDQGSEGLHQLATLRKVTGVRIADTLSKQPAVYSDARRCLAALPRVRERLDTALRNLVRLYPQARTPPVTIAVGRGKPVGVGSPVTGLQIGLEALCGAAWMNPNVEDRFVHVIAHEYAHVQQVQALVDDEHPTVLERSLIEGAAEFAAELTSGKTGYAHFAALTKGREQEIETAFAADVDQTDLSRWVDNSTMEQGNDLGYWVGYRIVKAYYQRAADKQQAFRDILELSDPKAFLAKSGWQPGAEPAAHAADSPARLREDKFSIESRLHVPGRLKPGSYDVHCETHVLKSGIPTEVVCYALDPAVPRNLVSAVKRAARWARFIAATRVGEPAEVYMLLMVRIVVTDKEPLVLVLPNNGVEHARLGLFYIAPQRFNEFYWGDGDDWPYVRSRRKTLIWEELWIDEHGKVTNSRLTNASGATLDQVSDVRASVENMQFMPGFVDGKPVPMRYAEPAFSTP